MSIPPAPLALTTPLLQLHSFVVGSAFVGTIISVRRTRQSKIPCLGLSLELSFKGVLVTQGLLRILSGAEDVYNWAFHLISNPSLSSLILTGFQKSPTSFDFFEKDSSLRSRPRWNNAERNLTVGMHCSKKQLIASNLPPSSEKWISVVHETQIQALSTWDS